jgi:hypothetical protein
MSEAILQEMVCREDLDHHLQDILFRQDKTDLIPTGIHKAILFHPEAVCKEDPAIHQVPLQSAVLHHLIAADLLVPDQEVPLLQDHPLGHPLGHHQVLHLVHLQAGDR